MKAVFIDSHYDISEDNKAKQKKEFDKNTQELLTFAAEKKPMDMKDIEMALSEIHRLHQQLQG